MIRFLFGMLSIYAAGFTIRRIIFYRNESLLSPFEKAGLDLGFGSGILALAFFYMSFIGVSLTRFNMITLASVFVAAAAATKLRDLAGRKREKKRREGPPLKAVWMRIALLIIIGISVSVIFFKNLYFPMYEWASRSIFGIKAKVLYETKTIYDKDLLDKEFIIEHPEYPLLIPMLEDWIYTCRNSADDRFGKGFLSFVAVGFLCSIYAVQRKFCPSLHSLIFTALYATVYVFVYRAACGEADAPLAFYYFCAAAYLLLWMRFKRYPYLLTASLFTAFMIFTKNEASSFFMILSAALLGWLVFDREMAMGKKILAFLAYALPVAALSAPWAVYARLLPTVDVVFTAVSVINPDIFGTLARNGGRVMVMVNDFISDIMLKTRRWNLFWVIFFVIQLFSFKELFRKPISYLAFIVWASFAVYMMMFVTIRLDPAHMFVVVDRLALQVSGLALLLMSLLAAKKRLITKENQTFL